MGGKWFGDSQALHVSFALSPRPQIHRPCSPFWAHWFSYQTTGSRDKKESIKMASPRGGNSVSLAP